jgi:hypothetical protein
MTFGQIKTKKELPRKFVVGSPVRKPARLSVTVMANTDKLEMNRKRIGSKKTARGMQPFSSASLNTPPISR